MSRERKAVLVKFPLDEFEAIEAARGTTDRSTWIRERLREALTSGRPLMSSTERPTHEPMLTKHGTLQPGTITRW